MTDGTSDVSMDACECTRRNLVLGFSLHISIYILTSVYVIYIDSDSLGYNWRTQATAYARTLENTTYTEKVTWPLQPGAAVRGQHTYVRTIKPTNHYVPAALRLPCPSLCCTVHRLSASSPQIKP